MQNWIKNEKQRDTIYIYSRNYKRNLYFLYVRYIYSWSRVAKPKVPKSRAIILTWKSGKQCFSHICLNQSFWKLESASMKNSINKTGVINDPLGQPTDPAGSDFHLILKFWDGRKDGWTTCVKIVITTGKDCGRPRGSKEAYTVFHLQLLLIFVSHALDRYCRYIFQIILSWHLH